jgi:hypothetical protein
MVARGKGPDSASVPNVDEDGRKLYLNARKNRPPAISSHYRNNALSGDIAKTGVAPVFDAVIHSLASAPMIDPGPSSTPPISSRSDSVAMPFRR